MANNFEYKIHVSIDQQGLQTDVKRALADMAKEVKNNAFKIDLTGDPKDLVNQLIELKKMIPSLDLTEGLRFSLADAIKDNTDAGKKIISEFSTYVINAVNDAVSSIDHITDSIKLTQEALQSLQKRKKELLTDDGTADVVAAYEKAEKRFNDATTKFSSAKQNKTKLTAANEIRDAYQDMVNYAKEAGKQLSKESMPNNIKVWVEDIEKTFHNAQGEITNLQEYLKDVKVDSSYKQDLANIEKQIFENQNKLSQLNKDLENAKNPELRVKGKLSDTFLSDLQSQLDKLQGLEVKVTPKVDKDAKIELKADVKTDIENHTGNINPTVKNIGEQITEKKESTREISHELEDVQQKLDNIQPQKTQEEVRAEFEKTRSEVAQTVSAQEGYFESLYEKAKTTKLSYEEVIAVVNEAEKISSQFAQHKLEIQDTDFSRYDGKWENYDIKFDGLKANSEDFKQSLTETYKLYKNVESAIKNNAGVYKGIKYDSSDLEELKGVFQILSSYVDNLGVDINSVINSIPRMTKEFKELATSSVEQSRAVEENNRQYDGESEELRNINEKLQQRYNLLEKIVTLSVQGNISKVIDVEDTLGGGVLSNFEDKDFKYGDVQTVVGHICKLLEIDIPSSANKAKEVLTEVNTTASTPPDVSGQDREQAELNETAEAAYKAGEALKKYHEIMTQEPILENGNINEKAFNQQQAFNNYLSHLDLSKIDSNELLSIWEEQISSLTTPINSSEWEAKINITKLLKKSLEDLGYVFDSAEQKWHKLNQVASQPIDTTSEDKEQAELTETAQKADEATEAINKKNNAEQQTNNTPTTTTSQLEREYEAREKNVIAINEQAEAERALRESSIVPTTVDGSEAIVSWVENMEETKAQAQEASDAATRAWVEGLEKIEAKSKETFTATHYEDAGNALELLASELEKVNEITSSSTPNPKLDSIQQDIQEDIQEAEKLSDALGNITTDFNGAPVDVNRRTVYGKDKEGNEVQASMYSVRGEGFTATLNEEAEVVEMNTQILHGYTQAQNEATAAREDATRVGKSLNQMETESANEVSKAYQKLISDQEKYEASLKKTASAEAKQNWKDTQKEYYANLTKQVKEYIALKEKIASGNGIDEDKQKVDELENTWMQLVDTITNNGFFNKGMESKALSGIDGLESRLSQISTDVLTKNIAKLAEYQVAKEKALGQGYSENETYIQYLDREINKLEEVNAKLRSNISTTEQETAFKNAEAEAEAKVAKQKEANAIAAQKVSDAGKKENQVLDKTRAQLLNQASALTTNGKLMEAYGDKVRAFLQEIQNTGTTKERLEQIRIELTKISSEATLAGKSGKTLGQILSGRAKSLVAYLSTFASFYRIVSYVRTAISTIKELDTQLVDLRKTTTMTSSELERFYHASSDIAKQMGVTTSEIISQASAWSRLGYSSNEAATEMAKLSSQFTSISPGMTTDNATDYLVSTMKAYGVEVDEVERKIMDNVNRIGNTFATTNAEIGEMLTRSSAAMKAANNSLEETIALESAAVQITRNAETTGTAFRTVSMRIRGYNEESEDGAEELDESLQNISGDIADLTKVNGKGGISIFTDKDRTEYKSTYQILKEISEVWDELTDKQQADLLEKLGGKRGGQTLAGILDNFSEVDRALQEMENAAGSADAEMTIIEDKQNCLYVQ